MVTMEFGKITPESLAELKSRIGKPKPIRGWNREATKDAIWHFAEALGDDNPLWTDEEYASKSRYGRIIAPPTFLYTFSSFGSAQAGMGLPGVHALWAEDDWEFIRPVLVGDKITCTLQLVEVMEKPSRWGSLRQIEEFTYRDEKGAVVGRCRRLMFRAEGDKAKKRGKYADIEKYRYTEEELRAIENAYEKEERRGATPRYWGDVKVGDEITHVVKGPLTVVEMVTWLMGWGSPLCKASRIAYLFRKAHPSAVIRDPETNIPCFPEEAHWNEPFARAAGIGGGYDIGAQRISWFTHPMTNWIGDGGFLKRLKVQLRRPNYLGDTLWCRGKVTQKYIKDSEYLVDCDLWGDNQRGERIVLALATASFPHR